MKRSVRAERVHRVAVAVARLLDGRPMRARSSAAVFVHVPRTSGTSLIEELGFERYSRPGQLTDLFDGRTRWATFDHIPPHALIATRLVAPQYFERAYVFAMVRDPYTWAASMFDVLRQNGTLDDTVGFGAWLAGVQRMHEAERAAHPAPAALAPPEADWMSGRFGNSWNMTWLKRAWPQHTWLEGVRIDHLGRFEERAAAVRAVCEALGVAVPTEARSRRGVGPGPGELYDAEPGAAALVRALYAEDFDRFGYDPDRVPSERVPSTGGSGG